jgi:hypothetical protein
MDHVENALREYLCDVRYIFKEKEIIDDKAVIIEINETKEQRLEIKNESCGNYPGIRAPCIQEYPVDKVIFVISCCHA